MMNAVDRGTLLRLAARETWPSVSIYLPVDHLGIHTDADRIRLRNLVKKACERLVEDGLRQTQADAMMAGTLDLAADDALWAGGPDGLAVFVTPETTEALWVHLDMPELIIVGDRFYLRPLFAAYTGEKKAWALAIDTDHTRLFHLDPVSIEEVALPKGTPVSLGAENFDDHEEQEQYHTMPTATPEGMRGDAAAMFHGHGGEKDTDKVQRERFLLDLGRGVVETIGAESSEPLVLLGVDYLIHDFRAQVRYSHVAPEEVEGATDYLSPGDVQRKVLAALRPRMEYAAAADVDEYRSLAGTPRASSDPSEILAAAAAGRVKTLVMDDSQGPWGWFDRTNFDVTHLCEIEPRFLRDTMDASADVDIFECGWDLIDLAAAETFAHGGVVHAYRGEASPVRGAVAVFRY
jgi:hypothetical protein